MHHLAFQVLACLALAGIADAQTAPDRARTGRPVAPLRTPIHTGAGAEGVAYGTWGAGNTFKASFHDGMTFVPYLGADYPHNQPWSWRTLSVAVGGVELLEGSGPPRQWHDDFRFEYRFGNVTEAYDVMVGGLEQSFVVSERPAAGDLVVRGAVTSALVSDDVTAAHRSLTFSDAAGRPVVGYGEAFAFDASGRHVLVTTGYRGGEITLTVPGSWLAEAQLPVTVDPLLSRVWLFSSTLQGGQNDIGHELGSLSSNVMTVYTRAASQFDDDVYGAVFDDDFTNGSIVFSDLSSSWDTDAISCAFVHTSQRWALVYRRYFMNNPIRRSFIQAHVHPAGSTTFSPAVVTLIPPSGYNDWRPDVGAGWDPRAFVVFQREDNSNSAGHLANVPDSAIRGATLSTSGTVAFSPTFEIHDFGNLDCERPAVNQVSGGDNRWACAFQLRRSGVPGDAWVVVAELYDINGNVLGAWSPDIAIANSHHQLAPVIAGVWGRFAVAFSTVDVASTPSTSGALGKELRIERFDTTAPSPDYPTVTIASATNRIFEPSAMSIDEWDQSHFVAAYRTSLAPVNGAYGVRVGFNGAPTEGPFTLNGVAGQSTTPPACTFKRDDSETLFFYGVRSGSFTRQYGHTLEYATPAPWSNGGAGCNPAPITWAGNQQIGAEFSGVRVQLPASAGHFLAVSLAAADLPVVNPGVLTGCRLLIDTGPAYLGNMGFRVGDDVVWRFPLPEWLPPTTLHFQDWILNGSQFESTRRLSVPVVK